jgi:hypothetical protein
MRGARRSIRSIGFHESIVERTFRACVSCDTTQALELLAGKAKGAWGYSRKVRVFDGRTVHATKHIGHPNRGHSDHNTIQVWTNNGEDQPAVLIPRTHD